MNDEGLCCERCGEWRESGMHCYGRECVRALRAELAAARKVVEAARRIGSAMTVGIAVNWVRKELFEYDAAKGK